MIYFFNLVIQIWLILNIVTTVFCLYHVVIGIAGFKKRKAHPVVEKQHRFAAIIAARNEEAVIANLIHSLKRQNYPSELLDVIVVADNCDDNTALVAEQSGAIVYKRFNKAEVGKGFVLKFVFQKIFEERDIYDAFCIIDADNVVDRNFFYHMNQAICNGYSVAQGYRDMKNPADTWVSGGHSLFYWMENRFFNLSRSILGLSATINGTGFMVRSDLIKEIGYNTYTVTEDIEYTLQCILAGYTVGYVPEAKVYDEQPLTFSQSMRQRMRWTNGLIQCVSRYTGSFVKKFVKKPDWVVFDALMYVLSMPMMFVGIFAGLLSAFLTALHILDPMGMAVNMSLLLIGSVFSFWAIGLLTLIAEKKAEWNMTIAVLAYPIFNMLWVVVYIACLFKKKVEWKPIVHVRNMSIQDIESTEVKR